MIAAAFAGGGGAASLAEAPDFQKAIAPFLENHCADCHDADKPKGNFRVDDLAPDFASAASAKRWEKIFDRVANGEMPPKKKARPPEAEATALLKWTEKQLQAEGARRHATEGRAQRRRLNRTEYENTLRDLLGADIRVAADLPEDGTAHGFNTVDEALTLSAVQMEKYLEAADRALDTALGGERPPPSKIQRFTYLPVENSVQFERERFEVGKRLAKSVVMFSSKKDKPPWGLRHYSAPVPGHYRVRVMANAYQTHGEPVVFRLASGYFFMLKPAGTQQIGFFSAPAGKPTVIETDAYFPAERDSVQITPVGLPQMRVKGGVKEYGGPGLEVHWVEIEGPLDGKQWPPASRTALLGNVDPARATEADVQRILRHFAPRAFRRPVTEPELAPYLALATAEWKKGVGFEQAVRGGLKAILVSPRFLMLDSAPGRLDGYALASRLSYFLWSTMPDTPLFTAASSGELANPQKLQAQVERMLAHPKARAFTENFTAQWLALNQIDATMPDEQLYPEFDGLLQVSMLRETRGFFDELLRKNLSVLSFIDSDWGMLNQRLAEHYQLFAKEGAPLAGAARYSTTAPAPPLVGGLEVQRVALPAGSHRGGVLTQGAVLKVSANGTTTSPVIRGVWLLERLLGAPVPPPPMNVAAIEPDIRGATTIREILDKHRAAEQCAVCHNKIDPPGYALENYDVIGGFRERYRVVANDEEPGSAATGAAKKKPKGFKPGPPVDPSDKLATGEAFHSLEDFKRLMLAHPEPIVRGLTERLLIYSTGHAIEFADRAAVTAIVATAKQSNYGMRSLIHAIVRSDTFQNK